MIRKQIYIEEHQDRALKCRAKELGVSEAQLVRHALDTVLVEKSSVRAAEPNDVLQKIFDTMDRVAKTQPAVKGYRFNRQEHYEEEERRKGLG